MVEAIRFLAALQCFGSLEYHLETLKGGDDAISLKIIIMSSLTSLYTLLSLSNFFTNVLISANETVKIDHSPYKPTYPNEYDYFICFA